MSIVIAFLKWLIASEAMRDNVADGGTSRILVTLVAFDLQLVAMLQNNVPEYALNFVRSDAWFDERRDSAMAFGHHMACFTNGTKIRLSPL
ncbi:hypothetical protein [Paenibacillus thalictri]|uniref:hypothetical protein n=1 Tax=Paenibacillus thalictri TaxID=2527873 RepID=UPI0014789CFF|nr:hypothetical protein [Paenibacillus thalictri]